MCPESGRTGLRIQRSTGHIEDLYLQGDYLKLQASRPCLDTNYSSQSFTDLTTVHLTAEGAAYVPTVPNMVEGVLASGVILKRIQSE